MSSNLFMQVKINISTILSSCASQPLHLKKKKKKIPGVLVAGILHCCGLDLTSSQQKDFSRPGWMEILP